MTSRKAPGWDIRASERVRPELQAGFSAQPAGASNRRRLRVFLGTLAVALLVSLAFTWFRPAEYRTSTLVEISSAGAPVSSQPVIDGAPGAVRPFLTEVQVLVSRPILDQVATRLGRLGLDMSVFGADPVLGMQSHLEAVPVAGTNVVELVATGPDPQVLAPLANTAVDVYKTRLSDTYRDATSKAMAQADEEVRKLETSVVSKRRDVEAFRVRNDIVSLQRDENDVLSRVRNLGTSLSAANDRVAIAEGKLKAIEESAAAGKAVVRPRDDPTLASLEQEASRIRADLRDMERKFTPDYMALDPNVATQRARLAELERQIAAQRVTSQKTSLLEAQEELASAKAAASRMQDQMAVSRRDAGQFTARFNEYKARQDELAMLEAAYRDAAQRRAKFDASELARTPTTKILELATTPQQPWRPLYWRDTAISFGGSLLLALLAMWLVELFNRTEARPAVIMIQPMPGGLAYQATSPAIAGYASPPHLESMAPPMLPRQAHLPRELHGDEVAALVRASDSDGRVIMLLLLSGLTADEAINLRRNDVDLAQGLIHVEGASPRRVPLQQALRAACAKLAGVPASDRLLGETGHPATQGTIDAQILCAAHDAGIEDATRVTSDCLRHTYVAFLVRQGIRFANLTRLVGPLPADILGAYSALAPAGARASLESISVELPAIRDLVDG